MKEESLKLKDWIDNASYEDLLQRWRFASCGDPFFQGETGQYYSRVMAEKKDKLSNSERVEISKRIGWEKP